MGKETDCDTITVREIACPSHEYEAELTLRDAVLRRPLGMSIRNDNLSGEGNERHIGAFCGDALVGCLVLAPLPEGTARMRQVAVAETYRGRGVGKKMVLFAEQFVLKLGCRRMTLHARRSAAGFYEKLGYAPEGEPFIEVSVPHIAMYREL